MNMSIYLKKNNTLFILAGMCSKSFNNIRSCIMESAKKQIHNTVQEYMIDRVVSFVGASLEAGFIFLPLGEVQRCDSTAGDRFIAGKISNLISIIELSKRLISEL